MKRIFIVSLLIAFNFLLLKSNLVLSNECLTQEQLEAEVLKERKKWDINLDNQYGIEEVVYGLQLISGLKNIETLTNDYGMTFVLVQPGTFVMGSPENELGRDSKEIQHSVTFTQAFYIQTTEVTQGQWKAVMGNNPSYFSSCGDNCPVEKVSWNDVMEFIISLNEKENKLEYRLPTEAEWEYAARAGSTSAFANGKISETGCALDVNLNEMGWYCGNENSKTHPVAQKNANAWGLFDMHGNVWEWCNDWYDSYPDISVTNPTGPSSGTQRVLRGGDWGSPSQSSRSAKRSATFPSYCDSNFGFRLSITLNP